MITGFLYYHSTNPATLDSHFWFYDIFIRAQSNLFHFRKCLYAEELLLILYLGVRNFITEMLIASLHIL